MIDCLFCKIISGKIPSEKIYEDNETFAFLDIDPISEGHTLVIPKEHAEMTLDASDNSLVAVIQTVKKVSKAIIESTGATGFNIISNNHKSAGQLVEHLHFHIIPRRVNDGITILSGNTNTSKDLKEVAKKIKENL